VVIISRGRLIVESSLEELTAQVGGAVRIRSSDNARLGVVLAGEAIRVEAGEAHALVAYGTTSDRVGDLAFDHGIRVHELAADGSSLEEVFLELTARSDG
jgi:ABC-2 type transport system ATP-binding protein